MKYKKGDVVKLDVIPDSYNGVDHLRGVVVKTKKPIKPVENNKCSFGKANEVVIGMQGEYPAYLIMWATDPQTKPEWIYEDGLVLA